MTGLLLSFVASMIMIAIVIGLLIVRHHVREQEMEARWWADMHEPPPTV